MEELEGRELILAQMLYDEHTRDEEFVNQFSGVILTESGRGFNLKFYNIHQTLAYYSESLGRFMTRDEMEFLDSEPDSE